VSRADLQKDGLDELAQGEGGPALAKSSAGNGPEYSGQGASLPNANVPSEQGGFPGPGQIAPGHPSHTGHTNVGRQGGPGISSHPGMTGPGDNGYRPHSDAASSPAYSQTHASTSGGKPSAVSAAGPAQAPQYTGTRPPTASAPAPQARAQPRRPKVITCNPAEGEEWRDWGDNPAMEHYDVIKFVGRGAFGDVRHGL
jgi:hypothetical protein